MTTPNYNCPLCGKPAAVRISEGNAQCMNPSCPVVSFNPSAPPDAPMCEAAYELRPEKEVTRLRLACIELSAVLSRIDYLLGPPNEMEVSDFDVHCDPQLVLKRVEGFAKILSAFVSDLRKEEPPK